MSLNRAQNKIIRQLFDNANADQKAELLAFLKASMKKDDRNEEAVQADSIEIFLAARKAAVKGRSVPTLIPENSG